MRQARGVRGHVPPENFKVWYVGDAISWAFRVKLRQKRGPSPPPPPPPRIRHSHQFTFILLLPTTVLLFKIFLRRLTVTVVINCIRFRRTQKYFLPPFDNALMWPRIKKSSLRPRDCHHNRFIEQFRSEIPCEQRGRVSARRVRGKFQERLVPDVRTCTAFFRRPSARSLLLFDVLPSWFGFRSPRLSSAPSFPPFPSSSAFSTHRT